MVGRNSIIVWDQSFWVPREDNELLCPHSVTAQDLCHYEGEEEDNE